MCHRKKGSVAGGIGPIAVGVKEPDKMEAGLLLANYCKMARRKQRQGVWSEK